MADSEFRKAGAKLLRVIANAVDPSAVASTVIQYAKAIGGVTQMFTRDSAGTIYQLTPPGIVGGAVISPTALGAGTTNNYAPTGLRNATLIRQDMSGANTVTGLDASVAGGAARRVTFINIGTTIANQLIFANESASSTAANRFALPGATDWPLPSNASITFEYDATSSRWRVTGMAIITTPETIITPTTLAANANNYNPTGLAGATLIRQQVSGSFEITGLVAQPAGTYLTINNIKTTGTPEWITFKHQNASSTAANRFILPGNNDWFVPPNGFMTFRYDGTLSRWTLYAMSTNNFPANDPDGNPGISVGNPVAHQGLYQQSTNRLAIIAGSADGIYFDPFVSPAPLVTVPNSLAAAGAMRFSSVNAIGPLSGTVNNQTVAGSGYTLRITTSAPVVLTGLTGGVAGRELTILNASTTDTITLNSEDAGSTAANRFLLSSATVVIPPNGAIQVWYDTTSSRWRALSL